GLRRAGGSLLGVAPAPCTDDRFPQEGAGPRTVLIPVSQQVGRCHRGRATLFAAHHTDLDTPYGAARLTRRAFVEAWGVDGPGARAILTSGELSGFVRGLWPMRPKAVWTPRTGAKSA